MGVKARYRGRWRCGVGFGMIRTDSARPANRRATRCRSGQTSRGSAHRGG